MDELNELKRLLYRAIRELAYVQEAEDISQCGSSLGKSIIEQGMRLLRVKDLAAEDLTPGDDAGNSPTPSTTSPQETLILRILCCHRMAARNRVRDELTHSGPGVACKCGVWCLQEDGQKSSDALAHHVVREISKILISPS